MDAIKQWLHHCCEFLPLLHHGEVTEVTRPPNMITQTHNAHLMKNSHHWSPLQKKINAYISSSPFEVGITVVVMVQMVLSIKQVDLDAMHEETPAWMTGVTYCFLLAYCVELGCRFFVYRKDFFKSRWHLLDFAVVCVDIFNMLVAAIFGDVTTSFAVLRVFRVCRIVRVGRLLKMCPELFIMVHSLAGTIRVVFWAGLLVSLMMTVWSMIAVDFLHPVSSVINADDEECATAFKSVYFSNLLFLQTVVAGDSFGRCAMPLMREKPWTLFIFMGVFATVGLGALNLILSAIVDRAQEVRSENEALLQQSKMTTFKSAKAKLEIVFKEELDGDGDGEFTLEEILAALEDSQAFKDALDILGLGKVDCQTVFHMMDEDNLGSVPFDMFADHLLKLKTEDQHMMLIMIKQFMNEAKHNIKAQFELMKTEQSELQQILRDLERPAGVGGQQDSKNGLADGTDSKPASRDMTLKARVSAAYNLRNADFGGLSDPYISMQLKGQDGKPKGDAQQTTCKRNTLNPVWDETFEFKEYNAGDQLALEVRDKDPAKTDDLLGKAFLNADQLMSGFDGDFLLSQAGSAEGKATLKLSVTPPAEPNQQASAMMPKHADLSAGTPGQAPPDSSDGQMSQVLTSLSQLESWQQANSGTLAALQTSCQEMASRLQPPRGEVFLQTLPAVPKAGELLRETGAPYSVKDSAATGAVIPEPKANDRIEPSWACCRAHQPIVQRVSSNPPDHAYD